MPRVRTHLVIAVAMAVLAIAHRTDADPIVVTGGTIVQSFGIDLPGFTVTGVDSRFTGVLSIGGERCCDFDPGDVVRLNKEFSVSDLPFQPTTQVVNGTAYPNAFLRGTFALSAEPFVAPPIDTGDGTFSFATPFDMTGLLSGYSGSLAHPSLLFSEAITGTGVAFVSGIAPNGQFYLGNTVAFQFGPAAPTPEPTTIVLLSTALVATFGAAAQRRRRRAEQSSTDTAPIRSPGT
jgi:hypothetical protein